jgi:hypothetical protein
MRTDIQGSGNASLRQFNRRTSQQLTQSNKGRFLGLRWIYHLSGKAVLRSGDQYLLTLADFSLENLDYAVPNKQSPGSFLTVLLDLTSKDRAKISCCFPKGRMPLFLLET